MVEPSLYPALNLESVDFGGLGPYSDGGGSVLAAPALPDVTSSGPRC